MRLYFFRHGPAGSRATWDGPDAERPLTAEGAEAVACMAERLQAGGIRVDLVISSPYVRAEQTANIASTQLKVEQRLSDPALQPGFGVPHLERLLEGQPDDAHIMFVGHEPDFSFVISELCGGGRVVMKKAGVARVDIDGHDLRTGELAWLLAPSPLGCHR